MSIRIIAALIVASSFAGCASYSEVTTTQDGVRTEKKFSGWTGSVHNPYYGGIYAPRRIDVPASASPATGIVIHERSRGGEPVLVHRLDSEGRHAQSVWLCPGGYQPIAGKC